MDVLLLVPYQECLALLDLCLGGFLGDIDSIINQCLSLHNSDSMDALLAVRPSVFAAITIRASEELCLCMTDILMVCGLMW